MPETMIAAQSIRIPTSGTFGHRDVLRGLELTMCIAAKAQADGDHVACELVAKAFDLRFLHISKNPSKEAQFLALECEKLAKAVRAFGELSRELES